MRSASQPAIRDRHAPVPGASSSPAALGDKRGSILKLSNVAAVATIIAAIIALLTYFSSQSLSPTKSEVPSILEKQADEIELSLKKPIYNSEKNWLALMFHAADEMPTYEAQEEAFEKVVDASLDVGDLNVAILAMLEMPTYEAKQKIIMKIVDYAVKEKGNLGYALMAAKKCPTYECKQKELIKVIDAYARIIRSEKEEELLKAKPDNENRKFLVQSFSSISVYDDSLTVTLNSLVEYANSPINLTVSQKDQESKTYENINLGQSVFFGKYQITYLEPSKNIKTYDVWLKIESSEMTPRLIQPTQKAARLISGVMLNRDIH